MGWSIQNLPQTASGVWVRCVHSRAMEQGLDRRQRIAIGSDHAGFELKQHLVAMLRAQGFDVDDQGTHSTDSVDYPEICAGVGRTVRDGDADVGIVLGGSGQGEQLAANKVRGVRAALCNCLYTARMARAAQRRQRAVDRRSRGRGGPCRGDRPDLPDHRVRGRTSCPSRRPDQRTRSPVLNRTLPPEPFPPEPFPPEPFPRTSDAVPLRHRSRPRRDGPHRA